MKRVSLFVSVVFLAIGFVYGRSAPYRVVFAMKVEMRQKAASNHAAQE